MQDLKGFNFYSKLKLNWRSSTRFTSVSLNYVADDLSIDSISLDHLHGKRLSRGNSEAKNSCDSETSTNMAIEDVLEELITHYGGI